MKNLKKGRDRNGAYGVDWSLLEMAAGEELPARIEFIPFEKGDARILSLPADETMYCGVGSGTSLTHGVIALRIDDKAVHVAMSAARLRQFGQCLIKTADMIDQSKGPRQ